MTRPNLRINCWTGIFCMLQIILYYIRPFLLTQAMKRWRSQINCIVYHLWKICNLRSGNALSWRRAETASQPERERRAFTVNYLIYSLSASSSRWMAGAAHWRRRVSDDLWRDPQDIAASIARGRSREIGKSAIGNLILFRLSHEWITNEIWFVNPPPSLIGHK